MNALRVMLWGLLLGCSLVTAAEVVADLPVATSLRQLASEQRARAVPLLLMISRQQCPYCVRMKADILLPLWRNASYRHRLLLAELRIDPGVSIEDYHGKPLPALEWAQRHQALLTPTLLFLGPDGQELTARLRGLQTPEMYGYYVDQAIAAAQAALDAMPATKK